MKNILISIAAFVILLFTTQIAQSQIIYTDLDPDSTVNEFLQGYGLDFNNDDKLDLHITLLSNVGVWVMHLIPDNNTDHTYVVYDGVEASVLNFGDDISASSNLYQLGSGWGGLMYGYWENDGEYGNWTGTQEDKYLGVKFEIGENFHYGWIYLTTHVYAYDDMEFTVQGYAYNSIANEAIEAGDMGQGVGIVEKSSRDFLVYPNPVHHTVNIEGIENIVQIIVSDLSGKTVMEFNQINNQHTNSLDLSHLNKGVYLLNVQNPYETYVFKIVKE